jgi:hypothetical protein
VDEPTLGVAVQHRGHQAGPEPVELAAGIAKAGHLDKSVGAEAQPRARREPEKVEPARRDVLPHGAGRHGEAGGEKLVVELGMDQMDLTQVGLRRIARHPRAVPDGRARVGVAVHP